MTMRILLGKTVTLENSIGSAQVGEMIFLILKNHDQICKLQFAVQSQILERQTNYLFRFISRSGALGCIEVLY